ncbi:MAG: hypothetical protein LBQ22_09205 [Bacteroidales bacterium]|jgi:hypothetical protein|nr:hypothetical protein [Bacteroidales bacterium]
MNRQEQKTLLGNYEKLRDIVKKSAKEINLVERSMPNLITVITILVKV